MARKTITKQQINEIINLYKEGMTPKDIGIKFGIYNNSVTRILRKNEIDRDQLKRVSPDDINKIIDQYSSGISSEIIASNLGINGSTVCRILKRNKIEIRPSTQNKRQYKIKDDFFNTINTEEKAYILGLLYADGSVSTKGGSSIKITLEIGDKDILEKISNIIYGFIKLKTSSVQLESRTAFYSTLYIYSRKMRDDLIKLGCTPQKAQQIKFPSDIIVPINLKWHFIRGYFDGDGCISITNPSKPLIDFASNEIFLKGLIDFVYSSINNTNFKFNKLQQTRDTNTYSARVTSFASVKIIANKIYENANIYLNRKYNLYQEFLQLYSGKQSKITEKYLDINNYGTYFIPTINGIFLTKDNIQNMGDSTKNEMVEGLFKFYREKGFPYTILLKDELMKEFINLKSFDVNSIIKDEKILTIFNALGLSIFKHFSPHFFDVRSYNNEKLSMLGSFNNDDLLKKIIKNRLYLEKSQHITGNMLKQGMPNSKIAYKASIFFPTIAKFIYSKYTKENDIIYDYSMGFGQRLLGALSLPYKIKYVGVDPYSKTVNSNQNIFNFFNENIPMFNKEVDLNCIGAEEYCYEKYINKVNFAFSSPPYWNKEIYIDEPSQATNYDYVDFINKWWQKVTNNVDKLLTNDGIFAINICDKIDVFNIKDDMSNIIKEKGYNLIDEYKICLSRNTKFNNKTGNAKYESILMFKK